MSKLILKMSMSLDGYVALRDGGNDWIFPSFSEDAEAWTLQALQNVKAHLMGAQTYRDMARFWPQSTSIFATPMNNTPKVAFSKSMTAADWADTTIASGDLVDEVKQLKQDSGGDLLAHGGARFARSLCQTGLIDEFQLLVHPVVLGDGQRIFVEPMNIEPITTTVFTGGAVAHVYRPA